jgi:transposase InsO family protein
VRWFRRQGIRTERVMTDNGACYRAHAFAGACRELGIRHLLTRPYTPRTNGKAERFIQTLLREWAYARPYRTSNQRTKRLTPWLRYYNRLRPHSALRGLPPHSRIRSSR